MSSRLRIAVVAVLLLSSLAALRAAPTARANEIIVSSVNYVQTPPDVLAKMFRDPADLVDLTPPATAPREVQYYQFLPGETFETDLSYTEVCKLLVPALAKRNLANTFEQAKVGLILRVSFGGRLWRDPFVREGDREWKHGLVPKRRRSGSSLAATTAWDARAGGNESALYQTEQTLTEMYPGSDAEGLADRLIGGLHTEEYFLIVVDAFDVATLRLKGNSTPRVWTTFIAVPRQGKTKFSDVAAAMIAKAAPYFGETLPGKARFTDREGKVTPGEIRVLEQDAPAPEKQK